MTKDELLKEVKIRFPIGTVFNNNNIVDSDDKTRVVTGTNFYWDHENDLVLGMNSNDDGCIYTMYKNGEFAKIISTPIKTYELW